MTTALRTLPLLLLLAACSGTGASPTALPSAVGSPPPSTAPVVVPAAPEPAGPTPVPTVVAVDWDAPSPTALPGGWVVRDCEGDAPLLCLVRDGEVVGAAEVTAFPVETLPGVARALAADGPIAALQVHAREFLDAFRADRAAGCGADYAYAPDEPLAFTAAGDPAVKTAFSGGAPGGPPTERVLRWVGLRDGMLVAVGLHATDEGACTPGEGDELTTDQLAELEPALDALAAASPLPRGTA